MRNLISVGYGERDKARRDSDYYDPLTTRRAIAFLVQAPIFHNKLEQRNSNHGFFLYQRASALPGCCIDAPDTSLVSRTHDGTDVPCMVYLSPPISINGSGSPAAQRCRYHGELTDTKRFRAPLELIIAIRMSKNRHVPGRDGVNSWMVQHRRLRLAPMVKPYSFTAQSARHFRVTSRPPLQNPRRTEIQTRYVWDVRVKRCMCRAEVRCSPIIEDQRDLAFCLRCVHPFEVQAQTSFASRPQSYTDFEDKRAQVIYRRRALRTNIRRGQVGAECKTSQ